MGGEDWVKAAVRTEDRGRKGEEGEMENRRLDQREQLHGLR